MTEMKIVPILNFAWCKWHTLYLSTLSHLMAYDMLWLIESLPQLQSDGPVFQIHRLWKEINADCCLHAIKFRKLAPRWSPVAMWNQDIAKVWEQGVNLICVVKFVVHEASDDTSLAHTLISQKYLHQEKEHKQHLDYTRFAIDRVAWHLSRDWTSNNIVSRRCIIVLIGSSHIQIAWSEF